jgi:L-erythro-3,5-diaminohexanoate dehydrogenase
MEICDNEILIDVSALNIDSASFTQIKKQAQGDVAKVETIVRDIVAQRGKHHNPVTGSGGMLIGTIAEIGTALTGKIDLEVGDKIATLVSLSLTPLRIDAIRAIHMERDQIDIEGKAILFETGLYAKLPADIPEKTALAILDVAGAPAQTARLVHSGDTVVVIGGGGKSGTLCVYEARKRAGPTGCVIGVSPFAKDCQRMQELGWADHALQVDATNALALMEAVSNVTQGRLADVVINCVNIPNTEMGSILATRQHGKIYFFSMATSFTAAALGAEGVGKDVEMIVGNGYAEGHAELALNLLRESPRLRQLFEELYV